MSEKGTSVSQSVTTYVLEPVWIWLNEEINIDIHEELFINTWMLARIHAIKYRIHNLLRSICAAYYIVPYSKAVGRKVFCQTVLNSSLSVRTNSGESLECVCHVIPPTVFICQRQPSFCQLLDDQDQSIHTVPNRYSIITPLHLVG